MSFDEKHSEVHFIRSREEHNATRWQQRRRVGGSLSRAASRARARSRLTSLPQHRSGAAQGFSGGRGAAGEKESRGLQTGRIHARQEPTRHGVTTGWKGGEVTETTANLPTSNPAASCSLLESRLRVTLSDIVSHLGSGGGGGVAAAAGISLMCLK